MRRQSLPVQYVSPLPLQLAALCDQPVAGMAQALTEELDHLWSTPIQGATPLVQGFTQEAQAVFEEIDLELQASGQLDLRLRPLGLRRWLMELTEPGAWPSTWAAGDLLLPKTWPLSDTLRLSPLVLLQHTQMRSGALLDQLPAMQLPGPRPAEQTSAEWSAATHKIIWALVDVIDTLAAADSQPQMLGKQACFLCDAFYQWSQHLYRELAIDRALTGLILQAVHRTLRYLLEERLGIAAAEAE
ncbi:MAG TPA: hypothetical protein V6D06_15210 [Trichocoleus sp.]